MSQKISAATKVAVLATGSELTDGRVLDTNSNLIARTFTAWGFQVEVVMACRDDFEEILSALDYLGRECDLIIVSGGLGPTSDDLTRDAIAKYLGVELEFRQAELKRLEGLFKQRGRKLLESNKRQVYFPANAAVISNPRGTAQGFWCHCADPSSGPGLIIAAFPGVPSELTEMLQGEDLQEIVSKLNPRPPLPEITLKIFGLPESEVGERVPSVLSKADGNFEVSYRAKFPEIHVKIGSPDQSLLAEIAPLLKSELGPLHVFGDESVSGLPEAVHQKLIEQGKTLALAESCTGGLLSASLTEFSGASQYLLGSIVCYSNQAKESLLGVTRTTLHDHGAVSAETAKALASGALEQFCSDIAISITGIAGPDGGSEEKPVGTFFVGLATEANSEAEQHYFPHARTHVQRYAAHRALYRIWEHLGLDG